MVAADRHQTCLLYTSVKQQGYSFSDCLYCDALLDQYRVLRADSEFFLAEEGSYTGAVEQIVQEPVSYTHLILTVKESLKTNRKLITVGFPELDTEAAFIRRYCKLHVLRSSHLQRPGGMTAVSYTHLPLTLRIISGSAGSATCQIPSGSLLSGRAWKMTYS